MIILKKLTNLLNLVFLLQRRSVILLVLFFPALQYSQIHISEGAKIVIIEDDIDYNDFSMRDFLQPEHLVFTSKDPISHVKNIIYLDTSEKRVSEENPDKKEKYHYTKKNPEKNMISDRRIQSTDKEKKFVFSLVSDIFFLETVAAHATAILLPGTSQNLSVRFIETIWKITLFFQGKKLIYDFLFFYRNNSLSDSYGVRPPPYC